MSQLTEQLIDIIARPNNKRDQSDIEAVLSWLRRRTQILRNMEKRDLVEIVKGCQYETASKDDVIIQQGEQGDRMFIILRGSALVYIDASLTGEEDLLLSSPAPSPNRDMNASPDAKRKTKALERSRFGKYIMKYEIGKSFGEAALLSEDKTRNATVVADEDCDFLVIDQALFDRRFKALQELEYAQICKFVDGHPFFGHMSPKFKRLLELSLRKETYPFDSHITRQGEPVTALYFILEGQANMYLEPNAYQNQYPHLWPFEAGTDLYSQEFEWLRETRKNAILRKYEDPAVWPTKSDYLITKRTEGYAAAEKMVQDRTVCLCSVHGGEVIGDLEIVQKLGTYMATVTCTALTTLFILDVKNLERLVGRRNMITMEVMKETAKEKLEMRANSCLGKDIIFLNFLLHKITEERLPSAKKLPPIKSTKQLPGKDIQIQHLLERFKEGQAQLIEPRVPGGLIYKEQMQEKARIRANIRKRSTIGISAMLREARPKMNRRQPRSRREIVESLREMMEAELVEYTSPVRNGAGVNSLNILGDTPRSKLNEAPESDRKHSVGDTSKNVRFAEPERRGSQDNSGRNSKTELRRGSNEFQRRGSLDTPRRGSDDNIRRSSVDTERRYSNSDRKKNSDTELRRNSKENLVTPRQVSSQLERRKSLSLVQEKSQLNLPAIVETREPSSLSSRDVSAMAHTGTKGGQVEAGQDTPPSAASSKREYQRKEVAAISNSPTRLPPLAKPELKKPENVSPTKWESALKFVNDRINDRFTKQLLSHGPGFDDYETSDTSLSVLEYRIKSFFVKHIQPKQPQSTEKQDLNLPKLRRFKCNLEDADVSLPKPGGKVWIRKRLCRFANSKIQVKNHEHVRYHMVPELPQFESVQKTRVIMHHLMAGTAAGNVFSGAPDCSP